MRPAGEPTASAGRLVAALGITALLLAPFSYFVYGAGLGQSVMAVGGLVLLLAFAIGVAWASDRRAARR